MYIELFASLPNEVLNLIWINVAPQLKYSLNKEYLNKYYIYRFYAIHSSSSTIIYFNNYNYYYYLLKNDLQIFTEIMLQIYIDKLISGQVNIKKHNTIYYKNVYFYSLFDFLNYYSINNYFINQIIRKYNLTHLIKKIHKNNVNKNIRWNI